MGLSMWTLPPTDWVLQILSFVAVAAQAMTAALAAGKRSMDWAGVCMLGCITALGGGTIRAALLGHYPLGRGRPPSFLLLAAGAGPAPTPEGPCGHWGQSGVCVACRRSR